MKMFVSMLAGIAVLTVITVGCATVDSMMGGPKSELSPGFNHKSFSKEITRTVGYKYLLYVPAGYGHEERRWPLILFLHGAGERGDDLELLKVTGLPEVLEQKEDFPFVVVAPQCPEDEWWDAEALDYLLDHVLERYDVDERRVYLTGLSMGGFGTWRLATRSPDRFAAIAPICGGGEPISTRRLGKMPVWVFHGAKDEIVPIKRSEEMVDALKRFGGNVKFTVYPDADHDSWTATYNNPELYEWFLEHQRE